MQDCIVLIKRRRRMKSKSFNYRKTGSGKSWAALSLAEEVVKLSGGTFNIKNVAFKVDEFAKIYNDIKKTPKGSVVIFDEIGVNFNSRDAMGSANKMFGKLLQIIRHRQILVIFTTPDLSFIDSTGRKLLHWWFQTKKIDKQNKITHIKPHVIEIRQRTGEIYYVFPMFNGNQYNDLRVSIPSKELREDYEKVAKEYKNKLAISTEIDLANINKKGFNDPIYKMYKDYLKKGYKPIEIREGRTKDGFKLSSHVVAKYNKMILLEKKGKQKMGMD